MEQLDFTVTEILRVIRRPVIRDWHIENVSYDDAFIMTFVLDGKTEYRIGAKTYLFQKNDIFLFPPKAVHSGRTSRDNPWNFVYIVFRMEMNEATKAFFEKPVLIWRSASETLKKQFLDAVQVWSGKTALHQVKCKLLCTEILYDLLLSSLPYNNVPHIQKLEKTRAYLQDHFRNEININALADSVDMSISYYRHLFHQAYGCSPMQYLMDLRIENARDLLLSGEVNVTEAAHLSGFNDIYYFSSLFKRKTGYSPIQLLKKGS